MQADQPDPDDSESIDSGESALYLTRRTQLYRRACVLLVVVPCVAAIVQMVANAISDNNMTFLPSSITHNAIDAVFTVMGLHVLLWWVWNRESIHRWKTGLMLLALITLGMIGNTALMSIDETYYGRWGKLPLGTSILTLVAFGWTNLAVNYFALLMAGSVIPYRFDDRVRQATFGRSTWSIRGLFAGTLVAALLLALLQWVRGLYTQVIPDGYYPTSDLAYVLWIGCGIVTELMCLYAAAAMQIRPRIAMTAFVLGMASVAKFLAHFFYWSFVPEVQIRISTVAIPVLMNIATMTILHWILLGHWRKAGYRLRGSGQDDRTMKSQHEQGSEAGGDQNRAPLVEGQPKC